MPSAKKTGGTTGRTKKTAGPRPATAKKRAKTAAAPKSHGAGAVVTPVEGDLGVPERVAGGRAGVRKSRPAAAKTITILQYGSGIACPKRQKRVLRSLGLRHPHHSVVRPDNPAVRGMVNAIPHLVRIVVEGGRGA
jgi:large subunit ribosomal protein L30